MLFLVFLCHLAWSVYYVLTASSISTYTEEQVQVITNFYFDIISLDNNILYFSLKFEPLFQMNIVRRSTTDEA